MLSFFDDFMKRILFFILFLSASLLSFSQKRDTMNLFGPSKKKVVKDQAKELESHPQSKLDSVYYIKYGSSITPCTGYCSTESTVDSIHIIRIKKPLQADKTYPAKTDSTATTEGQWNMLIMSLDINSFFSIPEKVGNPGANGEASQWIEVNYTGNIHKVTYDKTGPEEYQGIKNLDKILKRITGF